MLWSAFNVSLHVDAVAREWLAREVVTSTLLAIFEASRGDIP